MCGIAGFWDAQISTSTEEGRALTRHMTDQIAHRGPDAQGHWGDEERGIFLGHRRLSILDLSAAGVQPMTSHDDRYVMVFNGEIYNFKDIATKFPKGTRLRGHSDTEILLESFARFGVHETLQIAKGMFAIALWDRQEKTLTLIRDHVGKKPLYMGWVNNKFIFASELKAFAPFINAPLRVSREALKAYNYFGFIPAPHSIYENIFKIPPGHFITICERDIKSKAQAINLQSFEKYWNLQGGMCRDTGELPTLKGVLQKAVCERMISDVPLGAFLSGGIDSSLITALMQEQSLQPIKTYSIGFTDKDFDESKHAERIAKHLGTDHMSYHVTEATAQDIIPDLPRIYDEPFADYSQIPTAILCQQARQDTIVALSGDGGDEVFCGYKRYFMLKKLLDVTKYMPRRMIASLLKIPAQGTYKKLGLDGDRLHSIAGFLEEGSFDGAILRALSINPNAPRPDLGLHLSEGLSDLERMMMIDTQLYLPDDILVKIDRASMNASLEVRSPLLDKDVIEYAWTLPISDKIFKGQGRGKRPLYELLCEYVPENLVNRPKQGFTPPIAAWLRGDLRGWAEDLLNTDAGLYEYREINSLWSDFIEGRVDHHRALWGILMAQSWALNNNNNFSRVRAHDL